jgi:hypothetical protein
LFLKLLKPKNIGASAIYYWWSNHYPSGIVRRKKLDRVDSAEAGSIPFWNWSWLPLMWIRNLGRRIAKLEFHYFGSLKAFGAFCNGEFNGISFIKRLITIPLYCRMVYE